MVKAIVKTLVVLLFVLGVVVLARAWGNYSRQPLLSASLTEPQQVLMTTLADLPLDMAVEADKFAQGLRLQTIQASVNAAPFATFLQLLPELYPQAHAVLTREIINDYSVIYRWNGVDGDQLPLLSLAHIDVVPVADDETAGWTQAPFAGVIADEVIWGRGALDFKLGIFAQLAAVEALIAAGYQPRQDIVLAFGHDEETRGNDGAAAIARYFADNDQRFAVTLDEGGVIAEGLVDAIDQPVATIGIAEKNYLTIELSIQHSGGHASIPATETATTILSQAIASLQQNLMPTKLTYPTSVMLDTLAPELQQQYRIALSNQWLLGYWIQQKMASTAVGAASLRNTQAVTMLSAGVQENVVPANARAVINYRLLPGVRDIDVVRHVQQVIHDERVFVTARPQIARGQHYLSSSQAKAYTNLAAAVQAVWPTAVVVPNLALASMDARHFEAVSKQVYRFVPIRLGSDVHGNVQADAASNANGIHGINERIPVAAFEQAIRFYMLFYAVQSGLCHEASCGVGL